MAKSKRRTPSPERELDNEAKTEEIERQRTEQEYELRRQADAQIRKLKLKIRYAKAKSRELDHKFLAERRADYATEREFLDALHKMRVHHQEVIKGLETELHQAQKAYKERFESPGFKTKRWFYGVGKEFSRITWLDRKGLGWGFVTVSVISLILAILFLIIDVIFSAGYF